MKKYLIFLVVVMCLVLAGCSSKNGNGLEDVIANVKLTVEVKEVLSGEPVEEVEVMVEIDGRITTKETDQEGQAIFLLKQGNYSIIAAKDDYISSGTKRIELKNDKKVLIEMGREINEVIESDTEIINNGLYEIDFSEISEQEFTELLGTRVNLKLSEKDSIIPVDIDDIAGSIISLNFIKEGQDSDITFKIKIKVPGDIEDYGLVLIEEDILIPLSDIEYDDESIITNINMKTNNEIILAVYDKSENELKEKSSMEDAKKIVEDIRKHGVNLKEVGTYQENIIINNFENSLSPYATAISRRFEEIGFAIWLFEDWLMQIGPGQYKLDIEKLEDLEELYETFSPKDYDDYFEEYEEYLEKNKLSEEEYYYDNYYWQKVKGYNSEEHYIFVDSGFLVSYKPYKDKLRCDFSFGEYNVTIEANKADQDYEEVHETEEGIKLIDCIYLTDLEFHFNMTSSKDTKMKWSFDFSWLPAKGAKIKEFVRIETEEYEVRELDENGEPIEVTYKEIYIDYIYYPERAIMDIKGLMTDNKTYLDDENKKIPPIGKIILDGDLDMFTSNKNMITFDGRLDTEKFDFDGYLDIDFKEKRSLQEINDNHTLPQLNSFDLYGRFATVDYEIDGSCNMLFTYKDVVTDDVLVGAPLPEQIYFSGNYNNLSEKNFSFNGDIKLTLDYSNYIVDFREDAEGETEDNYLPFTIDIDGVLSQADYADSKLDLQCERIACKGYQADFTYRFPIENEITESRYIAGFASINNNAINVRVYNQDNILLELINEYSGDKIGEIRDRNTKEVFGEIFSENGDPIVRFEDGVTMRLLP